MSRISRLVANAVISVLYSRPRRSLLTTLGLRATPSSPTPNHAAGYIIGNWFLAHGILNPRAAIRRLGQDHNNAPRENLLKYGEAAVQAGKITRGQLNRLKRREAAYENVIEGFPLFIAGGTPFVSINHPPGSKKC